MRAFALLCAVAAALLALRGVDVFWRVTAPNPVTVAFSEGGDDAYYYFAVARNVAQGHGITIDGVHWTSGFQPLWGVVSSVLFLIPWERATFAAVYLASILCWVGSALLLVRFVRRASTVPVDSFMAAAIAVLFLCERQLSLLFINGMETGLHCLLVLGLLTAFQDYFQQPAGRDDRLAGLRLGVLSGLAMLGRNDVVFLCGPLLAFALFDKARPHRLRDIVIIVVVASAMLLPWLAYCQWVVGSPVPQSGIATSDAVRHVSVPHWTRQAIAISLIPVLFFKVQDVIVNNTYLFAFAGLAGALALAVCVLRPRAAIVDSASRRCLLALTAFGIVLLAYYPLVSAAVQFYERYFASLKLLVLILLALALVQAQQRLAGRRRLVERGLIAAVLLTFATNLYQTVRDIGVPWKSHMGAPALEILNSPLARDGSRIGMMESGRLGYLFPDRVVNLDGKMNVEALRALRTGKLLDYLKKSDFDYLVLHAYDIEFFDRIMPAWRDLYAPDDRLKSIQLFARKR